MLNLTHLKLVFPPNFKIVFVRFIINKQFEIMKTSIKQFAVTILSCLLGIAVAAQTAAPAPYYLVVTTMHSKSKIKDFSMDEWKKVEKEYYDKVVSKNEHMLASNVMTHYFTADNTEILFITLYKDWSAIEKAGLRTEELVKAGWSDAKNRDAFFDKRAAYYEHKHSDEIYVTVPGMKELAAKPDKPMIYYVRKSSMDYPKDGSEKDFDALNKQYMDAVINKNDLVKAYYQYAHAYGSNRTDYVEISVFETLGDIEKSFDKTETLFKAAWADEKKRKQYEDNIARYFVGSHGDYVYRSVPELMKSANHSAAK